MAPQAPTPSGVVKVQLVHKVGEDTNAICSLHFGYSGSGATVAGLNALASAIGTAWGSSGLPTGVHQQVTLETVNCLDAQNPSNPGGSASPNVPGTVTGDMLTAETCLLLNLHINRRYRGGKPRVYLPYGQPTQLQDMQTWTTGALSFFTTHWTTFINSILAFGGPPVLTSQVSVSYTSGSTWHQKPNGSWVEVMTPRATPIVDPVTGWTFNAKPGSQRRRMLR